MLLIIHRYLIAEIISPFLVSLLAFTTIVFSGRLLIITRMILVKGIGLGAILASALFLFPYLLVFTLPMAATVGIILALMRLSVDHEMLALKTAGLSYVRLLAPILGFALVVALFTLFLSTYGSPWGQRSNRELLTEVVKRRADLALQEQTFNTDFQNLTLFVNRVAPHGGLLEGLFINDWREEENPQTIYAQSGRIRYDPAQKSMILRLSEGVVLRWGTELGHRQTVKFKTYELPLRLFKFSSSGQVSEREMSIRELREGIKAAAPGSKRFVHLVVELHQRLALPLGALLLCLLAIPLGLSPRIHGRSWGLIVGLLVFLIYYVVFTASWRLAFTAHLNPAVAPYLANILFALVAIYFWRRTLKELPLVPQSWSLRRLWFFWRKTSSPG
ncbi:MAG: LPS export ABC transporter permease LptF [Syntrophobacterales bacterium]|jgi:lipopolysaccharide export system permease protein